MVLGALGVVYGDIGTSPLYALRESFEGSGHDIEVVSANILGILSLIFWSLMIVVTVKYLLFVLRADNEGEGGILVLTSLITSEHGRRRGRWALVLAGLFGTALLYGDGMITPAISVLSAVEGTEVVSPALGDYVIPIAIAILVGLFAIQRHGTATIGVVFGPVMVVWFTVLSLLGVIHIAGNMNVLVAIDPSYALSFLVDNKLAGFLALGSVFLVVTGGEALYADMGHFGTGPIRIGWFSFALPALLLNYFGQGAMLLEHPERIDSPFYRMAPGWAVVPLVVLATAATVIASQALISGAFSLTRQAVQLGYAPRLKIAHTSETEMGQIYVPFVNWALMASCIALVIGFRTSTSLAAAYGVAVTATMVITTALFYVVLRERFGWPWWAASGLCGSFLVIDAAFLGANLFKIAAGGWVPLAVGAVVFTLMTTLRTGRRLVVERIRQVEEPLEDFVDDLDADAPNRAKGEAVFLFSAPGRVPPALLSNVRFNGVLHQTVVVLTVVTDEVPVVEGADRARVEELGYGIWSVELHYGFMEEADVPAGLAEHVATQVGLDMGAVTYFLGAESLVVTERPGMAMWREHLYHGMTRNSANAAQYFGLPSDRTITIGQHVEL